MQKYYAVVKVNLDTQRQSPVALCKTLKQAQSKAYRRALRRASNHEGMTAQRLADPLGGSVVWDKVLECIDSTFHVVEVTIAI